MSCDTAEGRVLLAAAMVPPLRIILPWEQERPEMSLAERKFRRYLWVEGLSNWTGVPTRMRFLDIVDEEV